MNGRVVVVGVGEGAWRGVAQPDVARRVWHDADPAARPRGQPGQPAETSSLRRGREAERRGRQGGGWPRWRQLGWGGQELARQGARPPGRSRRRPSRSVLLASSRRLWLSAYQPRACLPCPRHAAISGVSWSDALCPGTCSGVHCVQ